MSDGELMKALDNEAYIILLEDKLEAKNKRIEELEAVLRELPCLEPFTCGRGDYLCMSCELGEANEY